MQAIAEEYAARRKQFKRVRLKWRKSAGIAGLGIRVWNYGDCGTVHDRDVNAAKNILAAGLAVSACEGNVGPVRPKGRQAVPVETGNASS